MVLLAAILSTTAFLIYRHRTAPRIEFGAYSISHQPAYRQDGSFRYSIVEGTIEVRNTGPVPVDVHVFKLNQIIWLEGERQGAQQYHDWGINPLSVGEIRVFDFRASFPEQKTPWEDRYRIATYAPWIGPRSSFFEWLNANYGDAQLIPKTMRDFFEQKSAASTVKFKSPWMELDKGR